jgi:isoamylase
MALQALVRRLVRLRRQHPVFRQKTFFLGRPVDAGSVKDLAWFGADGTELNDHRWFDARLGRLGMYLDGGGIRARGPRGERVVDDSFLLLLHLSADADEVVLPGPPWATRWEVEVDTAHEDGHGGQVHPAGGKAVALPGRTVLLLRAVQP